MICWNCEQDTSFKFEICDTYSNSIWNQYYTASCKCSCFQTYSKSNVLQKFGCFVKEWGEQFELEYDIAKQ